MKINCSNCKHWGRDNSLCHDDVFEPCDEETFEPIKTEFKVWQCMNPKLLRFIGPITSDGFSVLDGEYYMAKLATGEDFCCIHWESI
jgi:hypothetical protein